ncbi:unnamed protein product [Staurois parvus]|uniref:Uncharacterized protein n=1 Tax=Staurois parvus TaxID=386267 RepID=A0ABN9CU11_9NEOB|nr:unnamed protein product [Staurois parvus]
MLLPGPESLMGPCTASPLLLSPSPTLPAMWPLSDLLTHCWCVAHFLT